jgi:GT2 family glycosyltransferase
VRIHAYISKIAGPQTSDDTIVDKQRDTSALRASVAGDGAIPLYDRIVCPASSGGRVAVVIVNYQSYADLRRCLGALAGQPGVSIVVDHDPSPDSADAIAREFPWVRLVRVAANEGFAAGVNRGACETVSDYLLLLNPDSLPEPGLCATLAGWLDSHPDAGAVGPRITNADGTLQASARRFPDLTTAIAGRSSWLTRVLPRNPLSRHNLPALDATSREPMDVDWVSGACMMVRRVAFDQVGGMDEGFFLYWEDADFCRRLQQAGWRTVYWPAVSVLHTGSGSSRHAMDASLVAFHQSAYRLFRKHARGPVRLLAPLVRAGLRLRLAFMRRIVRARARAAAGQAP